jgi:hypothetical protein
MKHGVLLLAIALLAPVSPSGGDSPASPAATVAAAAPVATTAVAPEPDRPGPELVRVSLSPSVRVVGADETEQRWVDEALARFATEGLALPDLDVHFFDDATACGGHQGLFEVAYSPWRVSICSELEFVAAHELAHAWEAANVDDDDRAAYVARRGLPTWNDGNVEWTERGVEDVAFTIQQNLMATNPPLASATWVERVEAYAQITGQPSPLVES